MRVHQDNLYKEVKKIMPVHFGEGVMVLRNEAFPK